MRLWPLLRGKIDKNSSTIIVQIKYDVKLRGNWSERRQSQVLKIEVQF